MSLSSAGMYQKAYDCLGKAWSLGVRNATVQKEFAWLNEECGDRMRRQDERVRGIEQKTTMKFARMQGEDYLCSIY